MERSEYLAPEVEIIDVVIEQGFATTGGPKFTPFGPEENWG